MKKFFTVFFVVLGVIFFGILLIIAGLFLFGGPDNSPTAAIQEAASSVTRGGEQSGPEVDSNPMLNESQEAVLETLGIDPASLPTEVTAEQQTCFEAAIGADRVAEIVAGDSPTATEVFKGRGCL